MPMGSVAVRQCVQYGAGSETIKGIIVPNCEWDVQRLVTIKGPQQRPGIGFCNNQLPVLNHGSQRQVIPADLVSFFQRTVQPLSMKNPIHFGCCFAASIVAPGLGKSHRISATTFKTGAVPSCKRGDLIQEEQLCIPGAHQWAFAVFEFQYAANPLPRCPTPCGEQLTGERIMNFSPTITVEQPPLSGGGDGPIRMDSVLQGAGTHQFPFLYLAFALTFKNRWDFPSKATAVSSRP